MLVRVPQIVHGKTSNLVLDCATGGDSTSGGDINGAILDRLSLPDRYRGCVPWIAGDGLANTATGGGKSFSLGIRLQHGDSSGGGGMADYSTGQIPADNAYFSSGNLTTDSKAWTTGVIRAQYSPVGYDINGAKRFLRAVGKVTQRGVATATAAGNSLTVSVGLALTEGDEFPSSLTSYFPSGSPTNDPTTATAT